MKLIFTILLAIFTIYPSSQKLVAKSDNVPIIVVPGFLGSVPQFKYFPRFAFTRGVASYVFEPAPEYEPLLSVLIKAGREVVFAGYDWRVHTVLFDGLTDGHINYYFDKKDSDLYQSGLDYFVESLINLKSNEVDIIAHSTGGIIVRAYIQSNIYGAEIIYNGNVYTLPRIRNLVMISVPNEGTPFAWNPWNGNMISMKGFSRAGDFFKLIFDMVRLGISAVNGPDHIISSKDVSGINSEDEFLRLYMPSLVDLLPVYNFVITPGGDTIQTEPANKILSDLNYDSLWFQNVDKLTLTFGIDNPTAEFVTENFGVGGEIYKFNDIENHIPSREYEKWYLDVKEQYNGDGVIPLRSLISNLEKINDIEIAAWSGIDLDIDITVPITYFETDHVRLLVNREFIKWIAKILR